MRSQTLKLKVAIYLAIALMAAMLVFTLLVVRYQRDQLLDQAVSHVTQLSEVITRSTRFAMLQNQPAYVNRILMDVGRQEHIQKVRIFSKDGRIISSTFPPEIGMKVNRKAEACFLCHQGETPLAQIPTNKRARIFANPDGGRLLGSMEVIRNEPSCYTAACHVHTKAQSVLGVLDIVYNLDEIDRTMRRNTITIAGFSLGFIVIASLFVSFFVHRLVYVPLRDLETGAKRLASGNLEQPIPVRSGDEFGQLAASFNAMTAALKNSQLELREWGHTLEQKVERRTQELRVAEAEAARGEKLASVGLLAAGIAHELNNPLTGILTFSHLLRKKMPDGSPEAEDLDLVIRETKRCAAIIRRLLDFAREKTPEKKFADLNQIIEDTVRIIERPASFARHRDHPGPRPQSAAGVGRRRPDQAGDHEHARQRPARHRGEGQHHRPQPSVARSPRARNRARRRCPWRNSRSSTPGAASRRKTCGGSSIPFSPRRKWERGRGWGCPSATASSGPTAGRSRWKAGSGRDPRSASTFP